MMIYFHIMVEKEKKMYKKIKETLTDVMDKEDHQTVLALSHAGACMCFLSTVIDPEEILKSGGFTNCCILHLQFEMILLSLLKLIDHNKKILIKVDF